MGVREKSKKKERMNEQMTGVVILAEGENSLAVVGSISVSLCVCVCVCVCARVFVPSLFHAMQL